MKTVTISTIVRDGEKTIENYHKLLQELVKFSDSKFYLSLYENDSTDNTQSIIEKLDWSFIENKVTFEKIGTKKFGSVVAQERVVNLANARNKTIDQAKDFIDVSDFVLVIEPDVFYKVEDIHSLINHESYLNFKCDLLTPIVGCPRGGGSLIMDDLRFYDTWALRRGPNDRFGDIFQDFKDNPIRIVWSTFSCVALYNADVMRKGIRFSGHNQRFNIFDCDTAVICEIMHENGYNKIMIDQSKLVLHL